MTKSLRIVSLVPSLTESLCDLGLQKYIVGCTNYCISPKSLRKTSTAIGGTKDPNIQKIISLKPTHIVINEEENTSQIRKEIYENEHFKNCQIIDSFPKTAADSIALVKDLGNIFECQSIVEPWAKETEELLLKCKSEENNIIECIYFIWRNPWMVAGDKTYISEMLKLVGFQNLILTSNELNKRYPILNETDPILKTCKILFFSTEPYPFKKRHIDEYLQKANLENVHYLIADGQNLSWYGTRTLNALSYLISLKQKASLLLL